MGLLETLNVIRERVLLELLDLDPVPVPPAPRAQWPTVTTGGSGTRARATTATGESPDQQPPPPVRLRVLSLNAWGLPIAPKCTERAHEIARAIEEDGGFDVVVLQEIWHRRERNILIARAEHLGFPYYHYFSPAVGFPVPFGADSFGTGLLVLSRLPIISALFHAFSLTGRPYALHEADFIANKGVGLLRLQTPIDGQQVDLYVTHLLANYNHLGRPGPGDRYLAHRAGQSYELARFISATRRSPLMVVAGDFNSPSDCLVLQIPRELVAVRDAFTDMNNHEGLTFATADNRFSHGEHPMRMDYILYQIADDDGGAPIATSRAERDGAASSSPSWHLARSDVFKAFFTDAKGEKFPLSDHFGVTAEFVFGGERPQRPCEQALGEASKERMSPIAAKSGPAPEASISRACTTTTCMHCDAIDLTKPQPTDDGVHGTVRCLQDVQHLLVEGWAEAVERRAAHLRRSAISVLVIVFLLAVHLSGFVGMTALSWLAILFLTVQTLLEYTLAFYFVTLEASTFTELANQIRLHLHAHEAGAIVL